MISPHLNMALARAKVYDLRRAADAHGLTHPRAQPRQAGAVESVTLRFGSPADQERLARLAELDSSTPPAEQVLLAEVDGQLRAALALIGGAVIARVSQFIGRRLPMPVALALFPRVWGAGLTWVKLGSPLRLGVTHR